MNKQLDQDEASYEAKKKAAASLMRICLPGYIVKCFVASGYDTFDAIEQMTINPQGDTDRDTDSLDEINHYVNKNTLTTQVIGIVIKIAQKISKACSFLPGHRKLIAKFVGQVKAMNEKLAICSKRKREVSFQQSKETKKSRHTDLPDDDDTTGKSMESIYRDARRQIVKWQKSQERQMAQLKEHEHYIFRIQIDERKGQVVGIRCEMCSKKYSLSNVNGQLKVSN